jgi:hypothetical protein
LKKQLSWSGVQLKTNGVGVVENACGNGVEVELSIKL